MRLGIRRDARVGDSAVALLFGLCFAGLFGLGALQSATSGLGWDDAVEQNTFEINRRAVLGLIVGDESGLVALTQYGDRYYGIGFHAFAYPIQLVLGPVYAAWQGLSIGASVLLVKHSVVFVLFFASGIPFFLIARQITGSPRHSLLFTLVYLAFPYVFGHGTLNVKDAPFMSMWLWCTWLSVSPVSAGASIPSIGPARVALLAAATGALLSIRIAGLLILLQYAVLAGMWLLSRKDGWVEALQALVRQAALFCLVCFVVVYASYPMAWLSTWELARAARYMAKHGFAGCTLTFGRCLPAMDLPVYYIPAWLSIKLPVLILLGFLLSPFAVRRSEGNGRIVLVTLMAVATMIPLGLVLRGSTLYDELRQLLFLVPLYLLVGMTALHRLSSRLSIVAGVAMLLLFAADHVRLNPYQYTWFNEAGRFLDIHRSFEKDYWGTVGRELASVAGRGGLFDRTKCVYADPLHLYVPFLEREGFRCWRWLYGGRLFDDPEDSGERSEPVQVAAYFHGAPLRRPGCDVVYEAARTYPLSGRRVRFGVLLACRTPYNLAS